MGPFVDRLVAYIEGPCGAPGFRDRMEGYPNAALEGFEANHFGGAIPTEFREFLLRMGRRPKDFKLLNDDVGGFDEVMEWYREGDDPELPPLPRGDSILIAVGAASELFLDGGREGRPVYVHSRRPSLFRAADSFELYCMQLAWIRYRFEGLAAGTDLEFDAGPQGPLERALQAARRSGLRPETCCDSVNQLFAGEDRCLYLRREEGRWRCFIRSKEAPTAKTLAECVARGVESTGATGPPDRPQVS